MPKLPTALNLAVIGLEKARLFTALNVDPWPAIECGIRDG
jgi:hypothetical protein